MRRQEEMKMPRKKSNVFWRTGITALRKKYAPRKTFDLVGRIEWIVQSASMLKDFSNQIRDKSKDHATFQRAVNSANKTLNLLNELSSPFRYDIDLFFHHGCKEPINALTNTPSITDENSIFMLYKGITKILNSFLENKQRHVNESGKNYRIAMTEHYVFYLIRAFHQMTGIFPECIHTKVYRKEDINCAEQDIFEGKCYDFLIDTKQILLDSFDVDLGADSYIGSTANTLITHYKKECNKG